MPSPAPWPDGRDANLDPRGDVAIVHDYLNQRGGAERVALELADMFPGSVVHTSLYRPGSTFSGFVHHEVRTSFLQKAPVDRGFRALLPLYPAAMRSLGPVDADIVLSSSSGWAHAVPVTERAFHAVYCHNPARWLYGREYLEKGSRHTALAQPLLAPLRRWDRRAADRADLYIANSENVRLRVAEVYRRDAVVVPPPVDVSRFSPTPRGERLLVVSRLLPYKRVELAVRAASDLGLGLDVVGEGPARRDLEAIASPGVVFHGRASDGRVTELMQSCRAFVLPGEEDFGIAPVEAQAAGKPVVAFGAGGALETVVHGVTGVHFAEQTVASLRRAIEECDELSTPPVQIAGIAQQFSVNAFRARIDDTLAEARAAG